MNGPLDDQAELGLSAAQLADVKASLAFHSPAKDDAARIDRIRSLEELKQAICAEQARETARFKASQLAAQAAAGARRRDLGRGITEQIALARRESPGRSSRLVALAEALTLDMPLTLRALTVGELSQWRAMEIVSETAFLSPTGRSIVDSQLADSLAHLSDRETVAAARRLAYALDPKGFVSRGKKAHQDRHVSMRPAPDTMARFSALLPASQGAALFAALSRESDSRRAAGDERSRGQLMADTLVERVTGQTTADQVPVEVQLVMSDRSLFGFEDRLGELAGYGPVPGALAREWVLGSRGGETTAANGQGLCERCNYAKETPGWRASPDPSEGAGVSVTVTTPTGHTYESRPPPRLLGNGHSVPRARFRAPLDVVWAPSKTTHVAA